MAIRTILDTDIGTDVDDCIALAVVLGSPEIMLEGVTCVYGDVALRSRMVRKLLMLAGRPEVPVHLGVAPPLLGLREVYWPGHEGIGLLEEGETLPPPAEEHAVDYLVRTVMDNPGEIHLLAIGPLTNVALALRREPRLAQQLRHLTIMGGVVRDPHRLGLPYVEHNFKCDPEAAHVVVSAGAPITLVPLDVTTRVKVRADDLAAIRAAGTPFHEAVATQIALYPRIVEHGETALHDPLAAAIMIRPDLVTLIPAQVEIEISGRLTSGMSLLRKPTAEASPVQVAIDVQVAAAEAFVRERLAAVTVR